MSKSERDTKSFTTNRLQDDQNDPRHGLNNEDCNGNRFSNEGDDNFKGKLLHLSCIWNNPELLGDLLLGYEAQNINSQDDKGRTALHEAVIANSLECVQLLLENGANPNLKQNYSDDLNQSGKTPLHLAVQNGRLDLVKVLLKNNANIFIRDGNHLTASKLARSLKYYEICQMLRSSLDSYRSNLYESLAVLVHKGDMISFEDLLSKTIQEIRDDLNGSIEIDEASNLKLLRSIVNFVPYGSNTLLFKACQEGHQEIVEKLIDIGADSRQHPQTKYSPLYIASYHNRIQICRLLLNRFPESVSVYSVERWLPIHAAVINGHQEIVKLLIEFEYPQEILLPFWIEKSNRSIELIDDHNRFNSIQSSKSQTKNSNIENCSKKFIYLMPFDVNAQDVAGQTILYLATLIGNQFLVNYLLDLRVKSILIDSIRDDDGLIHSWIANNEFVGLKFKSSFQDNDFDFRDRQTEIFEDCRSDFSDKSDDDFSNSSGDTSPDVTVIQNFKENGQQRSSNNRQQKLSTRKSSCDNHFDNLTEKLQEISHILNKSDSKFGLDIKADSHQIYLINPIKIDLYCDGNHETALHCAVKKRNYSLASSLLANGADPNCPKFLSEKGSNHRNAIQSIMLMNRGSISSPGSSIIQPSNLFNSNRSPCMSIYQLRNFNKQNDSSSSKPRSSSSLSMNSFNNEKLDDYEEITTPIDGDEDDDNCTVQSSALCEAIKNRDKATVDLLLRYGAKDNLDDDCSSNNTSSRNNNKMKEFSKCENGLSLAFSNQDWHFVSKLLSLRSFVDPDNKINKKSFDLVGPNGLRKFHLGQTLTVSSMFPSNPVMVDWHSLRIQTLDEKTFAQNFNQWLIDCSLIHNIKLKLCDSHYDPFVATPWNTALSAITRIDLSENNLHSVPFSLFTDLPSLKVLNLSKNSLQQLPSTGFSSQKEIDDDENIKNDFATAKTSKSSIQKMRKSQSVSFSLSSSPSYNHKLSSNQTNRLRQIDLDSVWNLPFLEELYVNDNQLETLPAILFQQPELKLLDASNNKLRTLPCLFWFAPKLSELNLSMNLLCDLPSPILNISRAYMDKNSSESTFSSHISKSISISSISSDLSIGNDSNKSFGECGSMSMNTRASPLSNLRQQTSLIAFDLNVLKPWSQSLTILDDLFQNQFDVQIDKNTKISTDSKISSTSLQQAPPTPTSPSSASSSSSQKELFPNSSSQCRLKQLNLSHNGFERIPFFLSCLANRLTHLNLSYNCLRTIFDPNVILGHFPSSLKYLDLSHNQISEWFYITEIDFDTFEDIDNSDREYDGQDNFDDDRYRERSVKQLCWHQYLKIQQEKPLSNSIFGASIKNCPYKNHTKLDQIKTLTLSHNRLKEIILTREELIDWIEMEFESPGRSQSKDMSSKFNFFSVISKTKSPENLKQSSYAAHISSNPILSKLLPIFAANLDEKIESNSTPTSSILNLEDLHPNSKASKISKLFFPNVSMLDFSENEIRTIPKSISLLTQLSVLNMSGNVELTSLPPEMGLLTKLWNLNTRNCDAIEEPLKTMINSKSYKTCDIISYLHSILEHSKPYNRLKLMLVGFHSIGKTTLLEQLRHEGCTRRSHRSVPDHWGKRIGNKSLNMKTPRGITLSTVGVDLCEWTYEMRPLKVSNLRDRSLSRTRLSNFQPISNQNLTEQYNIGPITFRTWDFGGQKEYYATHQYFLSKQSIYLVVWKITEGEKGVQGLRSWLVNIQSRAPNSPVIIVGTHYDLVKEFYPPFYSNELQNMIRERYMSDSMDSDKRGLPKVVATIEVSTKTRHNIRLLANLIYQTACEIRTSDGKNRLLEQKVPETYIALEEIVTAIAFARRTKNLEPVLSGKEFRQEVSLLMKERFDLSFRDYSELQRAVRFLHENGVLLHYDDAHLKDLYFLDPQWLCDMLAHVSNLIFISLGIMKTEHLLQLFKNTQNAPSNISSYLINLLNKFELAITWDNRTLLIPSLLPTEEQIYTGHSGWDIVIPLKSKLKLRNSAESSLINNCQISYKFINDLKFNEISVPSISDNRNPNKQNNVPSCTIRALARHDHSILRILLLSYVPCGFWSRLITRILADESITELVRHFMFCLHHQQNQKMIQFSQILLTILNLIGIVGKLALVYDFMIPFFYAHFNYSDVKNGDNWVCNNYRLEPNVESLTKLLVIIVEHIDTLLEDWYPSLGTRFIHTSDGKFLITRIVPCFSCMKMTIVDDQKTTVIPSEQKKFDSEHGSFDICKTKEILSPDTTDIDSNLVDFYKFEVKKAQLEAASVDGIAPLKPNQKDSINQNKSFRVNAWMVEECILSVYEDAKLRCPQHDRIRISTISPDIVFKDLPSNYRIENERLQFGKLLGRGSFGFVFRAFYQNKLTSTKNNRDFTMKYSTTNSTFYSTTSTENLNSTEVALKLLQPISLELRSLSGIRKGDVEAYQALKSKWERDPLQYSCKAYCTARNELNILLTLKHSNIASIIGVCPKPLALVLTLAPQGSLDLHVKSYRRSGVRILPSILQKTFLQISKALEYLHQHHIIYRDLKSENILVWSFPQPITCHSSSFQKSIDLVDAEEIHLKIADYGISRSSLPTGTKGFGGTEGFMAPEIMLFNGEEEYTEKVDCFSFAMLMYELSTLHYPFEGQEFAIRESILDGIRPSISQRDVDNLPETFIDLMTRSWAHEPNERPTMSQIVSILSAPEFGSLQNICSFSDDVICAIGFRIKIQSESSLRNRYGMFLSKTGNQLDFLKIDENKWNPIGYQIITENLQNRKITSCCIVDENQLWLGDSAAHLNIYNFDMAKQNDHFLFVCSIELEFDNLSPSKSIKSIHWMSNVRIVTIVSNDGNVWLVNFETFLRTLSTTSNLNVDLKSRSVGFKRIENFPPFLCVANVAFCGGKNSRDRSKALDNEENDHFTIWCGQIDGKIAILNVAISNLSIIDQLTLDHYKDIEFNQANVTISTLMDVFLLCGSTSTIQPYIYSVLFSGNIIYQWNTRDKSIAHKLDCSKLAPCSESLMSISIEEHLKPTNCRISEISINEIQEELYVGTNFGCIIVAELHSLQPITVFRPYHREVKFILSLGIYDISPNREDNEDDYEPEDCMDSKNDFIKSKNSNKDSRLSVIKSIWPFGKSLGSTDPYSMKVSDKNPINTVVGSTKRSNRKRVKRLPFVTIGRGYRNLMDRFINQKCEDLQNEKPSTLRLNDSVKQSENDTETSRFHAIIWESGFW
ncbi:Leucine-rich repeat serine/threonine-protein kinase 1 [Sarcoptes scabiei]|uniref:non-specific serine/threonine protein kinase n=1 Tax=Sarcoptes scabiei TaxID=52283 RepID=A0A834VAN5_SARSC|nr:Leucine-rich repeat serine/threonine-protein kinase 1 [Sarcoptes scabiei]